MRGWQRGLTRNGKPQNILRKLSRVAVWLRFSPVFPIRTAEPEQSRAGREADHLD
jgi:hypothetical protein